MAKTLFPITKKATAGGHYWQSLATRAELRDTLRALDLRHFKQASIGGEQEQGFEQAFSSLGYAYIKDKAPRLLDFIVGFQLVDRNEDNTKAMGVFGFKVGEDWFYAPIFFLSGDLKGHELLYIKKQDSFVPMKENWINYLISRRPHELGKASPKNTYELGGLMPDIRRLSMPPTSLKYGSATPLTPQLQAWATHFLPCAAALMLKEARALYAETNTRTPLDLKKVASTPLRAAGVGLNLDLEQFLREDFGLLKVAFERYYLRYPLLKRGFDRFHGSDLFQRLGQRFLTDANCLAKRASSYIVPPKPRARGRFYSRDDAKRKALRGEVDTNLLPESNDREEELRRVKAAVQVVISDDVATTKNLPELTEEQREKLLRDTVLIDDKRDPHAKSMAYNTQVRTELTNPMETGLYDILERPGAFDEMLVVANPQSGRGRENFSVVVRKSDPRAWLNTHRTNLYARKVASQEDFQEWLHGLDSTSDLQTGGTYLALHENGGGTCPFVVREDYGDGAYEVEWKDYCQFGKDRPEFLPRIERPVNTFDGDYSSYHAKIYINKRQGVGLRAVRGELFIPEDYKILKMADPPKPKKDEDGGYLMPRFVSWSNDPAGSDVKPIQPGSLIDVQLFLQEKSAQVKILDMGASEVWLNSRLGNERMSKKAALICLVRDHGLDQVQAALMIKAAAQAAYRGRSVLYRIKYADGYPSADLQPGPSAPPHPQPATGSEPTGYGAVPSIYPQEEFLPVSDMDSGKTDPSIYDPFYMPDQKATQVAQDAAQSGQKEVFDTAMISGMLKSVNKHDLVDKYLGDLVKCLDRVGRIMFMFYWHQEDFSDRYGKQDLPELEDSIRNTFETLGDLCLYLQEKTVQGGAGLNMSTEHDGEGSGGGDGNSEPSVTDSARN